MENPGTPCCPPKFLTILHELHEGQQGEVKHNGSLSNRFPISTDVKQGCVKAPPALFSVRQTRTCQTASASVSEQTAVCSPFGISSHTQKPLRNSSLNCCSLMTAPLSPTRRKPYSISSTASLMQPVTSPSSSARRRLKCRTIPLFDKRTILLISASMAPTSTQLNTMLSWVASSPVTQKPAKMLITASPKPTVPLEDWQSHALHLSTQIQVYVELSSSPHPTPPGLPLPYGAETWVLYRKQIRLLEQFYLRCLRFIFGIKWQRLRVRRRSKSLRECACPAEIESTLLQVKLRWGGHTTSQGWET